MRGGDEEEIDLRFAFYIEKRVQVDNEEFHSKEEEKKNKKGKKKRNER